MGDFSGYEIRHELNGVFLSNFLLNDIPTFIIEFGILLVIIALCDFFKLFYYLFYFVVESNELNLSRDSSEVKRFKLRPECLLFSINGGITSLIS